MTKVAVLISAVGPSRGRLLAALRRHTSESLAALAARIESGQPVFEGALYGTDHQDTAVRLRGLCADAASIGAELKIVESLDPSRRLPSGVNREVSPQYLLNILDRADQELERQRRLMEHESEDDG